MKKFLALLLALMMVLTLAACGGEEPAAPEEEQTPVSDGTGGEAVEMTDEQLAALTEAYNEVAPLFNDVCAKADENGWMADEQTVSDMSLISQTLAIIGEGLADPASFNGADYDALPEAVRAQIPGIELLAERVSVPYEG